MDFRKLLIPVCLALASCAGNPPQPAAAPATALAAAPAAAAAPGAPVTITPEMISKGQRIGYKPQIVNGAVAYCRYAKPVGSHLSELSCIWGSDADALLRKTIDQEERTRETLEDARRTTTCGTNVKGC